MAAALREFVESEGTLPLRGSLPDMAADTKNFVTLQQIYQKQAHLQAEAIHRRAVQLAQNLGHSSDYITESDVRKKQFSVVCIKKKQNTWHHLSVKIIIFSF